MRIPLIVGLIAMVLASAAHAQTFGDWFVDTKGPTALYAASVNDSGHVFGQFCFPGADSCVWLIGLQTGCEKGAQYPVLANSDAGAVHLKMFCDGQLDSGKYRYVFTDFDEVDDLVRQATRIGFALPLQEDQFRVVRFNVRGAAAALSVMRGATQRRITPTQRGTRDEKM